MRIVYLLTTLGIGGAEHQVIALANRMASRGHSVALLVLGPRRPEEWPSPVPACYLGMRRNPASVLAGIVRAWRILRGFSPDLIHSHGFHGNMVGRLLHALLRTPRQIATVHNVYEGGRLRMLAYRITDPLSHRTTVVSHAVAHRFLATRAISPSHCVVVPNAVETSSLLPDAERRRAQRCAMGAADDFIWLAAGRAVPAKDYPNLLRAFARLRHRRHTTQLWIAGEGGDTNRELHETAAGLGVAAVRWLGVRRDLPALLDAADGFVMSSAWEGMPVALAEAMAMAKPVVATDVGGVRELTGNAAWIVPARDSEALSAAMAEVMREPVRARQARGLAARMRMREYFDMEKRAAEWDQFYRMLMPGSRRRRPS